MKRFMSITKPKDLIELGIILSTLSLMIFGLKPLALAVRSADSFRLEALVKVAGMLSVIPGVILGLTVIAKRYAANKESLIAFGSIMGVLLVSIFGLKPLVNAIHSLDNLDAHSIGKVAEIMAAIPMMLGIISTVMGRFGGTWQQLASFGSLVSALALCIPIINGLAWSIKKMDSVTTDSIAKMAAVIVSISIVMGGMSTIMAKFGKKWKALAVSFGGLIIALALCIPIISGLAWSIKKMVDVRPQEIAKVAATLISTVGILGAISTLVQRFGAQMTGNTMQDAVSTGLYIVQLYFSMLASLLFSNSLPKIAKSLQALKSVRVNDIIKGGIVVLSIFGTISGISTALYKLTKSHSSNLLINLTNTGILILDMLALVSSFAIFAASVPMLISSLSEIRNIRIQEILKAGTIIGLVIGQIWVISLYMKCIHSFLKNISMNL
ncbi:MAG: hypothetical protein IIT65_16015, partial [Lachnospiraceae bacterium]|nr:hypothetical protein [Lachnospiraceae bacterium]